MAKKITLTMLVLLIASALVFVSCTQEASGGKKPAPTPAPEDDFDDLDPVYNTKGTAQDLLVNGNFDVYDTLTEWVHDDAEMTMATGVGIDDSDAMRVYQGAIKDPSKEEWGQTSIDLTEYYGRGKSYYFEASFKLEQCERTANIDKTAHISFTVCSGAVKDAVATHSDWEDYYSCDDIYQGTFMDKTAASEFFGLPLAGTSKEINETEWVTLSAILDAETIDKLLVDTTKAYPNGSSPTMYKLLAVFYVGSDGYQGGYTYLMDNVVIKDLNKEIEAEGQTWSKETDDGGSAT